MKSGDIDNPGTSATDGVSTGALRRRRRIALKREKEKMREIPPLAITDDNINRITKALINTVADENMKSGIKLEKSWLSSKPRFRRRMQKRRKIN